MARNTDSLDPKVKIIEAIERNKGSRKITWLSSVSMSIDHDLTNALNLGYLLMLSRSQLLTSCPPITE